MVGDPVQQHLHAQAVRLGRQTHRNPPSSPARGRRRNSRGSNSKSPASPCAPRHRSDRRASATRRRCPCRARSRAFAAAALRVAFARQLAHVHFIDYSLVAPLGMQHNLRILIRNRIPGRQMYDFFSGKKSVLRPNRVKMGQNSWAGGYVYFIKNYYLCARYKTPYTKTKRSK